MNDDPNPDPLKAAQDAIALDIGFWSDFKRHLVYKILNGMGERMSSIDSEIAKAWRKEQGGK